MKIDLVADTAPSILLMNAVCEHIKARDLREVLDMPKGSVVEVKLTVNGVEIPFEQSIANMWRQANDLVEARALELAKEIVNGTRLAKLFEVLQRVEWEVESELNQSLERLKK